MRVLVTGANGFVGRALLPALGARGHEVRAAVRDAARLGSERIAKAISVGAIDGDTDWSAALDGVEAVVHLAARTHVTAKEGAEATAIYAATNIDGTRRLAEAAAGAGVRRVVYLSSVKAGGEESFASPLVETDPPAPEDDYGRTKLAAERALFSIAGDGPMQAVALRPPLVYGPDAKGNLLQLLKACDRSLPLPLGSVSNLRSLIYVGNLADAILRVLDHPDAAGKTFYVRDGEDLSTPGLVRGLSRALGKPPRLLPFPVPLLRLAGRLTGRADTIRRLTGSLQVDDAAIRGQLGWTPPFSVIQGFAETAAWFAGRKDT